MNQFQRRLVLFLSVGLGFVSHFGFCAEENQIHVVDTKESFAPSIYNLSRRLEKCIEVETFKTPFINQLVQRIWDQYALDISKGIIKTPQKIHVAWEISGDSALADLGNRRLKEAIQTYQGEIFSSKPQGKEQVSITIDGTGWNEVVLPTCPAFGEYLSTEVSHYILIAQHGFEISLDAETNELFWITDKNIVLLSIDQLVVGIHEAFHFWAELEQKRKNITWPEDKIHELINQKMEQELKALIQDECPE